ncbi:MAG: SusC/RagA family TonB-linked outer membrane protein, partial [Bacteroidales bacterium]|nr:SusC/RagA family TonB-linked outer membrane protein [Bacteroidales bacterium]
VIQQSISVSGRVTDSSGTALPGVTVVLKGTTSGTITDVNGDYSLSNVPGDATLVFSFVGMKAQEIVVGGQTSINIVLQEETLGIDEVVVTAFGISRETKQLTYVAQQVEGEKLSATGNIDVTKSLQGKVAGVTVQQLSGMPGESSKVTIRGSSSIAGNNAPLYVVDGFPIGSDISFKIDPNEVASMSVLKGAAASALYGLRASNGVILITTKKGETNELGKPTISINTTYSFDRLSIYPDMQKSYGQGTNFVFDPYSPFAWGPRIDQMGTYTNQLGEQEEARAYDNVRDFFKVGGTLNTNLNVSNRFSQGNYSIGISYNNQQGIVDYTDLNVYGFKLAGDYELSKKLTFSPSINFSESKANQTSQSFGNSSLFYAAFNAPPSYNLKGKPTHVPGNPYQQINFRGSHDNIYWARENNRAVNESSSFIGNVGLNYKLTSWMDLNYRIGVSQISSTQNDVFELGSGETNGRTDPPSGGMIYESMERSRDVNSNFNLIIKKELAKVIDLDFLLGHEFFDMTYKRVSARGQDLVLGGFHSLTNASTITANQTYNSQRSYGIFSNLNIGYKDLVFLNASGRNDVLSNMPRNNRSFFYPSIGMGFVFSELFNEDTKFLSFGKLRASYAEVGQAGPIYATNQVFVTSNAFTFPYNGISAFRLNPSLASFDLQPQNTKTWEFGVSLNFMDNRIKLDYAYFDGTSEGQILSVPVPASTGYTAEMMNAGEMSNNGHEVMLNLTLVKNRNINWDFSTNFSSYTNKVVKLAEGINQLGLGGFRVGIVAEPGQEYPIIRGSGYARDSETGKIVVDSREFLPNGSANAFYGMPLRSSESSLILGKVTPDFEMNFLNTFQYKNLTIYAQIDWRQGGKMYSGSSRLSKLYGTHPETANREDDVTLNAVKGYYDGGNLIVTGENDITIQKGYTYFRSLLDGIAESNVYDASFIRLREVRLEYQFGSFNRRLPFKDLSLFVTGRNLWLIKSGLPHFDPEMGGTLGNYVGEEYVRYPQTSSYGIGLNVKF